MPGWPCPQAWSPPFLPRHSLQPCTRQRAGGAWGARVSQERSREWEEPTPRAAPSRGPYLQQRDSARKP